MNEVRALYKQHFCQTPAEVKELPASGSNRRYFRMTGADGTTVIGAEGTSVAENDAFIAISRHFSAKGLPVPKVLAVSSDRTCYIQEDLGNISLYDAVAQGRTSGCYSDHEKELLRKAVSYLPSLQFEGAEGFDFSICYPQPSFDARMVSFDLNYFKYSFLKCTGVEFDENALEDDFMALGRELVNCCRMEGGSVFMYRDFQARNVMMAGDRPFFIDFQGGRKGPAHYDVASFLWQARAGYSAQMREELLKVYLESLRKYLPDLNEASFRSTLRLFVFFRTLQVLGAYGFRGLMEHKSHFLSSIPYAMDNLREVISAEDIRSSYPYLCSVLEKVAAMPRFSHTNASDGVLEVKIFSFSYKKGIPEDFSGNGGGYVFDCRSLVNPGRYPQYSHSTGMDPDVRKFMEDEGGVFSFLENVYSLADAHVDRYLSRGFTNLMFSFGCTGGQHRSVYCADSLYTHLSVKYGRRVRIIIIHREQDGMRTAMVLAAGLGTRLRPLTDTIPKALVPYRGRPMLESLLDKLALSGFNKVVINVHHFAEKIEEYISANRNRWPMQIEFSDERDLLRDTGGAVRHAAALLSGGPCLIHNVDIISDTDLSRLYYGFRRSSGILASLLVSDRVSSRYFLFDDDDYLAGWTDVRTGQVKWSAGADASGLNPDNYRKFAFSGIHVISPRMAGMMKSWPECFSIVDFYLSLPHGSVKGVISSEGETITDIGKIEQLSRC